MSVDLAIEQSLIASLKGNGGLTRGRDFNELAHLIWVMFRPVVSKPDKYVREMTKVDLRSPEQSSVKAECQSRVKKDVKDLGVLGIFFAERFLFDPFVAHNRLMNIGTGLVAPPEANIHLA